MLHNYENAIQLYICIFILTCYTHSFKIYLAWFPFTSVNCPDAGLVPFPVKFFKRKPQKSKNMYLTLKKKNRCLFITVTSYETNHYFQPLAAQIFIYLLQRARGRQD